MKFASSIIIAFLFAVQSALATTLYRNGGATKAYNSVRTPQDYDKPVKGIIPANSKKGVGPLLALTLSQILTALCLDVDQ